MFEIVKEDDDKRNLGHGYTMTSQGELKKVVSKQWCKESSNLLISKY